MARGKAGREEMHIVVLGAGLMGRAVVYDLARTPEVRRILVADSDRDRAEEAARQVGKHKAHAAFADVRETSSLARLLRGSHVVVNCTQYNWNLEVMRAALAARVHYLDLGGLYHVTRKQFSLDRDFRRIGRLAIAGMGGAPGVTNVMARALADQFERVESIRVYNAARDQQRYDNPLAYTFSIATILDELTTRPVHFVQGRYVEKPILSDPEPGRFARPIGQVVLRHSIHSELGTLAESFRKQGVREVFFKINYAPELVNLVRGLSAAGLTSREPVAVNGSEVPPRELLLAVLRKKAPSKPAKDVEALRVIVSGRRNGQKVALAMEMWAGYTTRPPFSAVARDTGFPAAVAAVMLGRGEIRRAGVEAPENAVLPEPLFAELRKRGLRFRRWQSQPRAA
jgi:lysine 6-dehydrogenase